MGGAAKSVGGIVDKWTGNSGDGAEGALGMEGALGSLFNGGYFKGIAGGGGGGGSVSSTAGTRPELSKFESALTPSGLLAKKYQLGADPVSAQAVTAGTVGADKVTAGTVKADQLDTKALSADSRALDAMRERALSKGDSPWLKMQLDKQKLEETSARDQAAQQALSGAATARSQLAMRGGLGGGASTRIAMQSARDMNAARQGIGRAGQMDRLNLGIADDQTKMGLLGQTAGLDLTKAAQGQDMAKFNAASNLDASKFNTGLAYDASKTNASNALDASKFNTGLAYDASKTNAANTLDASKFNSAQTYDAHKTDLAATLGQLQQENQYNLGKYSEDMKGYAAGKTGDAIANAGKK